RSNVGMVQRGKHFGFALKARHAFRIVGKTIRQDLDGDFAFELCVSCAIDLAHAADANQGADVVMAEFRSRTESHTQLLDSTSGRVFRGRHSWRIPWRSMEVCFRSLWDRSGMRPLT